MRLLKFLISACLIISTSSFALATDQNKPAYFRADKILYNIHSRQITYIGHVHMQQGTTKLSGDKAILNQNPTGGIKTFIIYGRPAHYFTLSSKNKQPLQARADQINYNANTKLATLIGHAVAVQKPNQIASQKIWYDTQHEQARTAATSGQHHTRIVLGPQDN
ncbi:MAG: lipopolysaccharide transport periplasmic protein LptA [Gammaproteobacteria bacterium]|nr:lipopolysaccharide transport periplasmic protein LptA [Gammaproteobacteria bacterium]